MCQAKDTSKIWKKKEKNIINGLLFTRLPKNSTTETKARLFPRDKGCIDSAPQTKLAYSWHSPLVESSWNCYRCSVSISVMITDNSIYRVKIPSKLSIESD